MAKLNEIEIAANEEMKTMIEDMKCCGNCKNYDGAVKILEKQKEDRKKSTQYIIDLNTPFKPEDFGFREIEKNFISIRYSLENDKGFYSIFTKRLDIDMVYVINGMYCEINNKHEAQIILKSIGVI